MLRRKALRKIFITTATVFILMVVYFLPYGKKENPASLDANLDISYITGVGTNDIYLLNQDQLLVKAKVLIEGDDPIEQVKQVVELLKETSEKRYVNGFQGILPSKTKVLDVTIEDGIVHLNLSKEFLDVSKELSEKMIEAVTYSICELDSIKGLILHVEGAILEVVPHTEKKLPPILNKNFGINKKYELSHPGGSHKVVMYYLEEQDDVYYYVPVTKYVNDDRDKIKIVIDNLTSNYIYEPNLMSLLNHDVKLMNYEIEDRIMTLDFNQAIFNDRNKILEEVIYTIAYSVLDNYDVDEVLFQVDGKQITNYKAGCKVNCVLP